MFYTLMKGHTNLIIKFQVFYQFLRDFTSHSGDKPRGDFLSGQTNDFKIGIHSFPA